MPQDKEPREIERHIFDSQIVTIRAEPTLKERIEKLLKAFDLEDKPVELRLSRCLTATTHYAADLR